MTAATCISSRKTRWRTARIWIISASQYFRSEQQDPPFFSRLFRYFAGLAGIGDSRRVIMDLNIPDTGKGNSGSRLVEFWPMLDKWADAPFTKFGANGRRRAGAPRAFIRPKEIYIPSPDDSQNCFAAYQADVAQRQKEGRLQPGEDVQVDYSTTPPSVQVSGQVAVMMINGLLCKVIFDHNPTNDFYVEESFPLEWMYPYETPFGIIMKINRNPLVALPDGCVQAGP